MLLEKKLENFLDFKEIKSINPKGNQFWIFIGRTDAEAGTPILCPPDAKSGLIGKEPDAGKDWRQEEKGGQMLRWLDGFTHSMDVGLSKFWELMKDRGSRWTEVHGVRKNWTQLNDWTTTINNTFQCQNFYLIHFHNDYALLALHIWWYDIF